MQTYVYSKHVHAWMHTCSARGEKKKDRARVLAANPDYVREQMGRASRASLGDMRSYIYPPYTFLVFVYTAVDIRGFPFTRPTLVHGHRLANLHIFFPVSGQVLTSYPLPSMNHDSNNTQRNKLTGEQVSSHNNSDSCWVIVHGRAYDVTEFLPEHPGGSKIILKYAGKDATEAYEPIHPPDTLDKYLDKSKHLGEVDMATVQQETKEFDPDEEERQKRIERMPILEQCYNLMDFEAVARNVMKKSAWAYYSSGADDEIVSLLEAFASPDVR